MKIEVTYIENGEDCLAEYPGDMTPKQAVEHLKAQHPEARNIWCRFFVEAKHDS